MKLKKCPQCTRLVFTLKTGLGREVYIEPGIAFVFTPKCEIVRGQVCHKHLPKVKKSDSVEDPISFSDNLFDLSNIPKKQF